MKKNYLSLFFMAVAIFAVAFACSKDESVNIPMTNQEAQAAWGEVMAGNDPQEITWPDLSENYWEYTMDVASNPNVGIKIKGQFPKGDVRFFNVTLYDDNSTLRITSIEDFNILPDAGSKNPFAETGVSGDNYFELNLIPSNTSDDIKARLKNVRLFPEATGRLCLLLRIYFNNLDHAADFGGVAVPALVFFNVQTGEEIKPAVRATSTYYDRCAMIVNSIPKLQAQPANMFTLAPNLMYSNGPTGYVTAANRMLSAGDVLFVRFIPPVHGTSADNYRTADVRYWSICVGDTTTKTPITIPDHMAIKDGEYVNFAIVAKNDTRIAQLRAVAPSLKINLIEWDLVNWGEPMMIFYRQMYIREGFAKSVQLIAPYPPVVNGIPNPSQPVDPATNLANMVLGQNGPVGIVVRAAQGGSAFMLSPSFSTAAIRGGM